MQTLQDFMMLFRLEPNMNYQPTANDLAEQKKQWGSWIGGIASQAKLVTTNQLGFEGKQVDADLSVKEGIHMANNTIVGGNMVVKAQSIDEAMDMAKGCPILAMGGSVEVRSIIPMS